VTEVNDNIEIKVEEVVNAKEPKAAEKKAI
jgi:hypothetical protein